MEVNVFQSKKEKRITCIVFGIYMFLLCWLVLFKFATNIEEIPHMRGVNLIPFYSGTENVFHFKEVLYNVLVFVPAGYYLTAFGSEKSPVLGVIGTTLLSLFFEITQWIFAIGATDITDVITNTLGGFSGMLLFFIMGRIFRNRRVKIINILGIAIEVLGCLLLGILLIAN